MIVVLAPACPAIPVVVTPFVYAAPPVVLVPSLVEEKAKTLPATGETFKIDNYGFECWTPGKSLANIDKLPSYNGGNIIEISFWANDDSGTRFVYQSKNGNWKITSWI